MLPVEQVGHYLAVVCQFASRRLLAAALAPHVGYDRGVLLRGICFEEGSTFEGISFVGVYFLVDYFCRGSSF